MLRLPPAALLCLLIVSSPAAHAVEGKWTPGQLTQLAPAQLRRMGMQLPASRWWNPQQGTGLLLNAVALPGCSGAFVSRTGLIVTNHHCVASLLQQHSTPERNLFEDGHLARTPAQELRGRAYRIAVPRRFVDVTAEVVAAIPGSVDDLGRFEAVERKLKALVAACEATPGRRCFANAFDGGHFYTLTESVELADVRLVYAPPRSVGSYGGEVDNWMWPRHTGDFALLRAYEEDRPYAPAFYFPVSTEGVRPGDFVAVLGYPRATHRNVLAAEVAELAELWFPRLEALLAERISLIEQTVHQSPEGKVALADTLSSMRNRRKNAEGQQLGLARQEIVRRRTEQEQTVAQWAQSRPQHAAAAAARDELTARWRERRRTWERDFWYDTLGYGPKSLQHALKLVRLAEERQRPDLERRAEYMERELPRMRDELERDQKRLHRPVEERLLKAVVRGARALPPEQRIASVDAFFGAGNAKLEQQVEALYRGTQVTDLTARLAMFTQTPAALRARKDPLLELAFALDQDRKELEARRDALVGAGYRLRPLWRQAELARAGRLLAPDANQTLRVTVATVQGYSPRDGLVATPQTTLSGALAKHTGAAPFALPDRVVEAARARRRGRWADARLGDVPVAFLADADTTGGNSGSPTVDGKGRLVGVNFDRVWENVVGDFGFDPKVSRNINADIRYMLWMLEEVERADGLLTELGVPARPRAP